MGCHQPGLCRELQARTQSALPGARPSPADGGRVVEDQTPGSWCLYSAAVGGRRLRFVLLVRVGAVALAEACHGAAGHKPSDRDLGWTLVTVSHWARGTTTDTGRH